MVGPYSGRLRGVVVLEEWSPIGVRLYYKAECDSAEYIRQQNLGWVLGLTSNVTFYMKSRLLITNMTFIFL